ncbi:C40 family peptidase [Propionibacteriaceae bacterium Y1923]|uniref:C40 family peptidase n=1 Tax=Aestuariimicrobium sp. Y1814 TaxID=3418742 RepID=UPI003C14FE81
MSKIRNTVVALAAAVALGAGTTVVTAPLASASACTGTANVYCSMEWAGKIGSEALQGASNNDVTALQNAIQQLQLGIKITGTFDDQTLAYVLEYQKQRGLTQSGEADTATVTALRNGAGPIAMTNPSMGGKVPLKTVDRDIAKPLPTPTPTPTATPTPVQSAAAKAVAYAYAQIGKPYVYGATGPNSFDCSGLTGAAWKSAGVSVPRTSYAQLSGLKSVSKSALQPGDIIGFYSGGHVGIYVGNGEVIHASRPGVPIKKVPMSQMPYYKAVRPAA